MSTTIKPDPKFCTRCGRGLLLVEAVVRYNAFTGDRETEVRLECPESKRIGLPADMHDRYWRHDDVGQHEWIKI